jgi:hydroxyacylglutathione hydrolase
MAERVADGVWVLRLRPPGRAQRLTNVYLLEDDGGVVAFDSGSEGMAPAIAGAADERGGLRRIVLSHAHADHRGGASRLDAPVFCHPEERADVEGDGGYHYFDWSKVRNPLIRAIGPGAVRRMDGGPLAVEGTLSEGDAVAGFEVLHLPGHAPGLIGLWRESDRLALVSDCFYTVDPQTGIHGHPRVPHRAFNQDTEQARASIRKLAALAPATAWCGHADPLRGDVAGQLEHAAATP